MSTKTHTAKIAPPTPADWVSARCRGENELRLLEQGDFSSNSAWSDSWVRPGFRYNNELRGNKADSDGWLPTERTRFFDNVGFLLVKDFATEEEVASMKDRMRTLVEDNWRPGEGGTKPASFRTDEGQVDTQGSDDYFLTSADGVHYFAEKDALDKDGKLKEEYWSDKMAALNKAGHGMHVVPGAFRDYTLSGKVKDLVKELGWVDPVVPQSMYIAKQPRIGGEVTSHQDSAFLFTEPRQTCLGLWLALDDATVENGCLWVRPRSHKERLRRQFVRNPDHFGGVEKGKPPDKAKPQMVFRDLDSAKAVPWEGKLPVGWKNPQSLFDAGFVPVECRAGDLVAFPGTLDHLSLPNESESQRHTFQLHLVEGNSAGVNWSGENWLQYPEEKAFLSLILPP